MRLISPLLSLAISLTLLGCTNPDDDPELDDGDSEDDRVGWFEIGWGESEFNELPDDGPLRIVWGSQGLAMYPMPLRAAEFTLPDDPTDFLDEDAPILELTLDVEGVATQLGGHFKRIANYPVGFEVMDDGIYEFVYVAVIVPDGIDPATLEGRDATLWVQLTPTDSAPHVQERNLTITVDEYTPPD